MALVAILTGDPEVRSAVRGALRESGGVAATRSWERLNWLVRERPATAVVVDAGTLPEALTPYDAVSEMRRRFPSLSALFVMRPGVDPVSLLRLGRAGLRSVVMVQLDGTAGDLEHPIRRALTTGTEALVTRALSPVLPRREVAAVRAALDGALRGWGTDDVAAAMGLTRAHLSVRLKGVGLPPVGHLLMWAKMLHAARWLTDPGRSAESISRQLDYSSGAAFRRALRTFVGATPTGVIEAGGLRYAMGQFLDECGLGDSVVLTRAVA